MSAPVDPQVSAVDDENEGREEEGEGRSEPRWYSFAKKDDETEPPVDAQELLENLARMVAQAAAEQPTPAKQTKAPRSRQDVYQWWAKLPAKTKFLIRHSSAVALGGWSYGLLEGDFTVGLPQTFGAWMQASAASSTSPYTGLALGAFIVVGVSLIGTFVMNKVGRWLTFSPVLYGVLRYALTVPMSSAVFAVLIHTTAQGAA
ncbi:hypothetical protein [Streptomyces sp. gCLA4]|uniref:hypothetical protein n=1 Tax=Streptomyces sp. gCLA4 TaxID=1873416 RepID=UPI001600C0A7|nr:hypothetical protein [Streptomyces sp. gCLA4]